MPGRPRRPIRLPGPPRAALLWLLALFVFLSPSTAGAHPHIFFDIELDVHLGRNAEYRVEIRLHPDEMTGCSIACLGDENDDGKLDEEEMLWLRNNQRAFFKKFRYYVRIRNGEDPVDLTAVRDFAIELLPTPPEEVPRFIISYTAFADLPARAIGAHALEVDLTDPSYYAAFTQIPDKCRIHPATREIGIGTVKVLSHHRGVRIDYEIQEKEPEPPAGAGGAAKPAEASPPPVVAVTAPAEKRSLKVRFYGLLQAGLGRLAGMLNSLSREFRAGVFFTFIGFALVYGIFHALGPGHGKALVAAFLVRENTRPFHALLLSLFVTMTHTGTAVLLAGGIQLVKSSMEKEQFREAGQAWIGLGSGFLVLAIGFFPVLVVLVKALTARRKGSDPGSDGTPREADAKKAEAASEEKITVARIGRWGIAAGLVPCPTSIAIMMISVASGVFWVGLIAVMALAVGLSTVLLIIGLSVIYSRKGLMRLLEGSRWATRLQTGFQVAGVLLVIVLGGILIGFYWYRLQVLGAM